MQVGFRFFHLRLVDLQGRGVLVGVQVQPLLALDARSRLGLQQQHFRLLHAGLGAGDGQSVIGVVQLDQGVAGFKSGTFGKSVGDGNNAAGHLGCQFDIGVRAHFALGRHGQVHRFFTSLGVNQRHQALFFFLFLRCRLGCGHDLHNPIAQYQHQYRCCSLQVFIVHWSHLA